MTTPKPYADMTPDEQRAYARHLQDAQIARDRMEQDYQADLVDLIFTRDRELHDLRRMTPQGDNFALLEAGILARYQNRLRELNTRYGKDEA